MDLPKKLIDVLLLPTEKFMDMFTIGVLKRINESDFYAYNSMAFTVAVSNIYSEVCNVSYSNEEFLKYIEKELQDCRRQVVTEWLWEFPPKPHNIALLRALDEYGYIPLKVMAEHYNLREGLI